MSTPGVVGATPVPPRARTVSILPAASVVGIAVGTLLIFGLLNAFDTSAVSTSTLPIVIGGLQAGPAAGLFPHPIDGVPPADVAAAFIAPAATDLVRDVPTGGGGVGGYDRAVRLAVTAPRAQVLGFYESHLEALGWQLYSTSATTTGDAELLFQKAGSDGWYWEAGIVATSTSSGSTAWTFRLFQASDAG